MFSTGGVVRISSQSRRWRARLALTLSLTIPACQSWHTEQIAPQQVLDTRQPQTLRVTRADSSEVVLDAPELSGDTLLGVARNGDSVRVPLDSVRFTATRRFSPGRTVGLVLGLGATALLALVAAIAIGCNSGCYDLTR